ncbi:hypothetical protein CSA37_09650 [Candidatus Fermentibacteria bacterium]|nr:MAG: hypothetical protein CSA37_09650 [Candidatus Fermentibacteria bacterium]
MSRISEVLITSGVPGAGKSTWIRKNTNPNLTEVFSADTFFTDKNGVYRFNPEKLGEAHSECLRRFTERLIHLSEAAGNSYRITLAVDNTNTAIWEIAPYYSLAVAFRAPVKILRFFADPEKAFSRNVHGVQKEKVLQMAQRLENCSFPPFWNVEDICN